MATKPKKTAPKKAEQTGAKTSSEAAQGIPIDQDPPIVIGPGSFTILVPSKNGSPHDNRLIEDGSAGGGRDYKYSHNKPANRVKSVTLVNVDTDIRTPITLPANWVILIDYNP
jgi:hypothetical protein